MIVDVDKVIDKVKELLELNAVQVNTLVALYMKDRKLTILKGERATIPNSWFPALEIEPLSGDSSWQYCRTQREDIALKLVLNVWNGDEEKATEFLGLLTTLVAKILLWPPYLQTRIPKTDFFLVDSRAENVTYSVQRNGTVRVAEFTWRGWVIEHFRNDLFITGGSGLTGGSATNLAQSGVLG